MAKKLGKELDDFLDNLDTKIKTATIDPNSLQGVVDTFIKKIQNNLKEKKLEASGRLIASIQPLPIVTGEGFIKVSIELEDYWRQIEEGTKPLGFTKENRKKLQPVILRWIKEKPSLQRRVAAKRRLSLSYAIATNILKKGTIKRFNYKGYPFLTKELDVFKKNLIKAYEDGINNL